MERKGFDVTELKEAKAENVGYTEDESDAFLENLIKELNSADKANKEGVELDFDGCYDDFGYNKYLAKKGK